MWFRRPFEAGLDRELRYHFERLVREAIAAGMTPEEARRQARLEFGGMEQVKEDCRDVRGRWLQDFAKDLRYTVRTLRRSPGFLAVSVISLALGIGANTAIFRLVHAVILRSLPVKDPQRLVQIVRLSTEGEPWNLSYSLFVHFRDQMKTISSGAAEMLSSPAIVIDGSEEIVTAELVTGNHFAMMGMAPAAGRLLDSTDDVPSPQSSAAVISYQYWQRRFGLDPAAIGKTFQLQLRNKVVTIVGVTPQGYSGPRLGWETDMVLPLTLVLSENARSEPTLNMLNMLGRLAPGATLAQANAEIEVLWKSFQQPIAAAMPEKDRPAYLRTRAAVLPGANGVTELRGEYNRYSSALLVLMGLVSLVLLLGCANLSGLMLARAASREREIAVRLAMGAGGGRLMRQFLTESLVLAALGGGAGLLLSGWFTDVLVAMMSKGDPLQINTWADWQVLAFTTGVSLAACVLAGLAPGLHALRANLNPGLKQARAGNHQKVGKTLLVAQLSISMVLVVGAALFVGTLARLYRVDRGVQGERMLVFRVRTNERYSQERQWASLAALVERLNATPGVQAASAAEIVPLSGAEWGRKVEVEGYQYRTDESDESAFNAIAPRFFATTGTPVLAGREFDARDKYTAPRVAIVNESFAHYFFGGRSPLGRRVSSLNISYEIVGVVKDARYQHLRQQFVKTMYIPLMQREGEQPSNLHFLIRTQARNPMHMAGMLSQVVHETDPGLRVRMVESYSDMVNGTIVTERIMGLLGGFFGLLALLVAGLGIFGAMAFQVSRRTNEIGLRMALGASRGGIAALVLREVAAIVCAGCLIGTAVAIPLTGSTRKMLFGIQPTEPGVFLAAAAVLGVAALAAAWLPARRAVRTDPMVALRHE